VCQFYGHFFSVALPPAGPGKHLGSVRGGFCGAGHYEITRYRHACGSACYAARSTDHANPPRPNVRIAPRAFELFTYTGMAATARGSMVWLFLSVRLDRCGLSGSPISSVQKGNFGLRSPARLDGPNAAKPSRPPRDGDRPRSPSRSINSWPHMPARGR
jgi:hypothetical protein